MPLPLTSYFRGINIFILDADPLVCLFCEGHFGCMPRASFEGLLGQMDLEITRPFTNRVVPAGDTTANTACPYLFEAEAC